MLCGGDMEKFYQLNCLILSHLFSFRISTANLSLQSVNLSVSHPDFKITSNNWNLNVIVTDFGNDLRNVSQIMKLAAGHFVYFDQ